MDTEVLSYRRKTNEFYYCISKRFQIHLWYVLKIQNKITQTHPGLFQCFGNKRSRITYTCYMEPMELLYVSFFSQLTSQSLHRCLTKSNEINFRIQELSITILMVYSHRGNTNAKMFVNRPCPPVSTSV